MTLKDILVLQVSEERDDFVKGVIDFALMYAFEVLLELVVQVGDQTLGSPFVQIDELLKGSLDRQVYVRVSLETFVVEVDELLSELDEAGDELIFLQVLVGHQFVALHLDEHLQVLLQQAERLRHLR